MPNDPKAAAKRLAGEAAVDRFVVAGTCVGLGSGTTAYWAVRRVGERVRAGEDLAAVATSLATERWCAEFGIPLVPYLSREIDVAVDGADEIAPDFSLTKGGGGALFREKAVALAAQRFVVIADESKLVRRLGRFPTPVEVVPYAIPWFLRELAARFPAATASERQDGAGAFRSDNGNAVFDCAFGAIDDPRGLDAALRTIHGVVASGLFFDLAAAVLVAGEAGVREVTPAAR